MGITKSDDNFVKMGNRRFGLRSAVRSQRCVDAFVAQHHPQHVMATRNLVQEHQRGGMADQMDIELQARPLKHFFRDLLRQRILSNRANAA